jgi:anti-sigma factor (TIGR02949 family)
MQCAELLRVQAYFDGEVDAVSAADIERHAEHCAECRALLQDLEQVRTALRQELTYTHAPPALRARVMRALDQEGAVKSPRVRGERFTSWRPPAFWKGAFSGIGGTALAAGIVFFFLAPPLTNPILDDLVSAHVRSLMPDHLIDVVSTDKHTVKPWFAGHTDVSPVVADFGGQGYRLIGGRADYFDRQRAAVVVYQHGSHVINVFSWAADQRALPKDTTRNGYHLAFWKAGNLVYCAVSDTAWDELLGLVRLLQDISNQHP